MLAFTGRKGIRGVPTTNLPLIFLSNTIHLTNRPRFGIEHCTPNFLIWLKQPLATKLFQDASRSMQRHHPHGRPMHAVSCCPKWPDVGLLCRCYCIALSHLQKLPRPATPRPAPLLAIHISAPSLRLVPDLSLDSRPAPRVLPAAPRAGLVQKTTGFIWRPRRTRRAPAPL